MLRVGGPPLRDTSRMYGGVFARAPYSVYPSSCLRAAGTPLTVAAIPLGMDGSRYAIPLGMNGGLFKALLRDTAGYVRQSLRDTSGYARRC